VILVHILCLDDCLATTIMPQPAEITQFIFGQPLRAAERYPGCTFTSPNSLAKYVLGSAILDLLVQAYAEEVGRQRDAAGFIHEMAKKGRRRLEPRF